MKLPAKVSTIVVGNPLIADVTLQSGGIVVVTGKGYGATNFIAMDRNGEVLVDRQIQVEGPTDQLVTVYRGVERESYSCMPICQRRVTLGDGTSYFRTAIDQAGSLSSQASGGCGRGCSRRQSQLSLRATEPADRRSRRLGCGSPKMVNIRPNGTGRSGWIGRNTSTISFG